MTGTNRPNGCASFFLLSLLVTSFNAIVSCRRIAVQGEGEQPHMAVFFARRSEDFRTKLQQVAWVRAFPVSNYQRWAYGVSSRAFIPGSSLPSRNSRVAPPPVERCVILVATPAAVTAATVSPPAMMLTRPG